MKGRWREFGEVGLAVLVLAWRVIVCPAGLLWRDWIAVAAVFWAYTALRRRSGEWSLVTAALAAFLLGLYVHGQVPHTLRVLGFLP